MSVTKDSPRLVHVAASILTTRLFSPIPEDDLLIAWMAIGMEVALRDPKVGRDLVDEIKGLFPTYFDAWVVEGADRIILKDGL